MKEKNARGNTGYLAVVPWLPVKGTGTIKVNVPNAVNFLCLGVLESYMEVHY